MILIGEAGGSKTDWRLIDGTAVTSWDGPAFNAQVGDIGSVTNEFIESFPFEKVKTLHFYAAGLIESKKISVRAFFNSLFPNAVLQIEPDTLAAARALFGKEPGFVGILGTGAAACFYNGHEITSRIPSLGYILGDEGSGFDLAKRLIKAVLRDRLPLDLSQAFHFAYPNFSESELLSLVYQSKEPAKSLAAFTQFLTKNQHHAFVIDLIDKSFEDYFNAFSGIPNQNSKWAFTGSIAFHFREQLMKISTNLGFPIIKIVQSPIDGLVPYHQTYG